MLKNALLNMYIVYRRISMRQMLERDAIDLVLDARQVPDIVISKRPPI